MPDTVPAAHTIRIVPDGDRWRAWIGDERETRLTGLGETPMVALWDLFGKLQFFGWEFDADAGRPR